MGWLGGCKQGGAWGRVPIYPSTDITINQHTAKTLIITHLLLLSFSCEATAEEPVDVLDSSFESC